MRYWNWQGRPDGILYRICLQETDTNSLKQTDFHVQLTLEPRPSSVGNLDTASELGFSPATNILVKLNSCRWHAICAAAEDV